MSAHAFLPPSGAGAWRYCAAWPMMNAMFPQDDTDDTREGTAAHWCWDPNLAHGLPLPAVGAFAPNGVAVTDEMLDGAEMYIAVIERDLRDTGTPREALVVEQRIAMPGIHAQNWGTPDSWFFDPRTYRLYQYDYKFGHGFVDAYEHWQSINYTSGIVEVLAARMGIMPAELDQRLNVRITVVQPRNYDSDGPVRTWDVRASDLRAYWNQLASAAEAAMVYPPVATPGRHCKHCPGRHACQPLQRQGYDVVQFARQVVPAPLPAAAVAAELRLLQDHAELLRARISGLEADADTRLRRGEAVPGFGLENTKGREAWNVPREQVVALGSVFGVQVEKPGLITPGQARTAGMPADVVAQLSATPARGVKLVRTDQTRLTKIFGK
jgi:hypothetical protein